VDIPEKYRSNPTQFISLVGDVQVAVEPVAKVVINERTGTIVIGGAVRLAPVAVAQGGITVSVSTEEEVSQPAPKSNGETVVVPQTSVNVKENRASTFMVGQGDTVEDLIKVLNGIKATPRDIIAILQALKEAGSLIADLEML
jgi:flagellar P-ring protein precursor FlgI